MTTNITKTDSYARECEIYMAGACGWKKNGLEFDSIDGEGEIMKPSKCIYDAGQICAGKHPRECTLRQVVLGLRINLGVETIVSKVLSRE